MEIPALCYHVCVTQSPRFKRLLPIVQNVPRTGDKAKGGENRHSRRDGVAGEGHRASARAVCAEVLSVVHHCPVGDWDLSTRLWAIAVAREMAARW